MQIGADMETVVYALGRLAPGWGDRTGISHDRGWTAVPMTAQAADSFAPLLADALGQEILLWDVEGFGLASVRLGERLGPVDGADRQQVEEFVRDFEKTHVLAHDDVDEPALTLVVTDKSRPPEERRKAFAELLGVPFVPVVEPSHANPTTPRLTPASAPLGAGRIWRRRRISNARNVLRYAVLLVGIAFIGTIFSGPWPVSYALLTIALVMLAVRFWLGRSLRRPSS